jgi:putative peptide zinc metalloprotease protein
VTIVILFALRAMLKPWHLEGLVWILAFMLAAGAGVMIGRNVVKTVKRETSAGNGSFGRGLVVAVLVGALVTGGLLIPWPHYVRGPAILEPARAASIYAVVEGRLDDVIEPGTPVKAGDLVARLHNEEMLRQLVDIEGRRERQQTWVRTLESRRADDPTAAAQLPAARTTLEDLDQQLAQKREDVARLELRAPQDGVVLPPPLRKMGTDVPGDLPSWTGDPFDERNRHTWLETGTLVCQIGDAEKLEAVVYVPQSDIDFLAPKQPVELLLDGRDERLQGEILAISPLDLDELSGEQVLPERLTVVSDPDGSRRLAESSYQVRVSLKSTAAIPLRSRARARVAVGTWTAFDFLSRELHRTFRFVF